jgi:hypothetical protein
MQPKPSTSTMQAKMNAFWKAIGSSHHEADAPRRAEARREAAEVHPRLGGAR